jgi:hypothetical protein
MRRVFSTLIMLGLLGHLTSLTAVSTGDTTAVQGLSTNTLVAGKTTAFRLFTTDAILGAAFRINASVTRPDGSGFARSFSRPEVVIIPQVPGIPGSLVLLVRGKDLPWVGSYRFDANVTNGSGAPIARFAIGRLELTPTRDIIAAIDRINGIGLEGIGVNPGTAVEIQAARDAMQRLAAVWPIRDGVSTPDGDRTAGLRFVINNKPQPYNCNKNPTQSDCQQCPFYAGFQNRPEGTDSMNLGIGFRFQNPGEVVGGIAPNFCATQTVGWASIVSNGPLAPGFGQETGHVFGLEPPNDPHYDPSVQKGHSRDTTIDATDVALGFDIQTNRPFRAPMFDAMHQAVCGCQNDQTAYNAWDWEFLRTQLVKLKSTGPTAPDYFLTDAAPAVAGVGNSAYFFARRTDGRIFNNRAVLGQAGVGWAEIEGGGFTDAPPSAAAVGGHVFVGVKGLDGRIYINQADEGKPFGQWFPMDFRTDVAPALAAVGNRIFVFAKGLNKRVYLSQAVLGQAFSGWFEVQGGGETDRSPSAAAVGDHVFVAIRGLDGTIQMNQADLGHAFVGWSSMNVKSNEAPGLAAVANSIFVFVESADGRIQMSQAELRGSFSGWFEVQGNGRTNKAPSAASVGKHLFVVVRGLDGRVYTNQTDFGKAFGAWVG